MPHSAGLRDAVGPWAGTSACRCSHPALYVRGTDVRAAYPVSSSAAALPLHRSEPPRPTPGQRLPRQYVGPLLHARVITKSFGLITLSNQAGHWPTVEHCASPLAGSTPAASYWHVALSSS
jgi:hypothetical protein